MPSLVVPEGGFNLESSRRNSSKAGHAVPDVLGLTLTDSMIEEMIKCVQNGKPIQLSLGEQPSFSYGTKTQHLSSSHDPFTYDLYQSTNSYDSDSSDNEMSPQKHPVLIANVPKKNLLFPGKPLPKFVNRAPTTKVTEAGGGDAALAQLMSQNAAEEAKKNGNQIVYIKDGSLPVPGKRGASKSANSKTRILSQHNRLNNGATKSMPPSPSLNAAASPSLGPTSIPASAQQSEQAKAVRKPVVHLLAVQPMTENALLEKLPDYTKNEFQQILEKVGDKAGDKWELNKKFYKELDVWAFDYEPVGDRQRAIDNAVRQYDKMRMGVSEPEWDRLLIKSERGTGKCLSKLQASIAQGTAGRAPKIKVQKADGSDTPNGEDDELFGDKNKAKNDGTPRSGSQPPAAKAKKPTEREAQAKRLLSNKPNKPVVKPAAKPAPAKKAAPQPKAGTTKALSAEFVEESDDDVLLLAPQPKPKPKPKPKAVLKRPREDDEIETSDSSAPLSKKVKKDTPVAPHRVSNASQTSNTTNTSNSSYNSSYTSSKNKNTSPHKSSPLASSPPTNASEFENSSGDRTSSSASPAAHPSIKNSRSPIHKRHQKTSSVASSVSSSGSSRYLKPDVADLARKFKMYYPKYEALHKEIAVISASGQRNQSKEKDLLEMHARLEGMKKAIFAGIITESDSQSN